ncbi:MAG TPA: hypothetical protein VF701_18085 [Thermoanaerobaculia bacterium]
MSIASTSYLAGSVIIGLGQVADSAWLLRTGGRAYSAFVITFSLIEYAWAVVSFLIWRERLPTVPFWLPASFVIYIVAFGVAGFLLVPKSESLEDFVIPRSLVLAGGIFGLGFCIASALAIGAI